MPNRLNAAITLVLMVSGALWAGTGERARAFDSPRHPVGQIRPRIEILVDGAPRPQYPARGTSYVEALKGREYEIRLTNPYPVRVAVALAVDGLNTIDARHTSAAAARKWVLGPYESVTISGWQTSLSHARRFTFTTEERSYGQSLGRSADLGVISAAFFRERADDRVKGIAAARESGDRQSGKNRDASTPVPAAPSRVSDHAAVDEYAATGIGRRTDHSVQMVSLDLEPVPAATMSLRYEFRPQLVKLGVLPPTRPADDVLTRREGARGFEPGFCPDPKRGW